MFLINLQSTEFEDEFLLRNSIKFGCDKSSGMLGKHTGIAQYLVEKYSNLIFGTTVIAVWKKT
jgi:hypothetical protein